MKIPRHALNFMIRPTCGFMEAMIEPPAATSSVLGPAPVHFVARPSTKGGAVCPALGVAGLPAACPAAGCDGRHRYLATCAEFTEFGLAQEIAFAGLVSSLLAYRSASRPLVRVPGIISRK